VGMGDPNPPTSALTLRMQTASMTSLTGPGGLFMPLTSLMSFLVRVSRACWGTRGDEQGTTQAIEGLG
jgi:hypothetical protein